jgi:hypothetical protein
MQEAAAAATTFAHNKPKAAQRLWPTVMSQELCSSQSSGAQRAATSLQLKDGLPRRLFTALCVRHIHTAKSLPLLTTGGSRLQQFAITATAGYGCQFVQLMC